MKLPAKKVITIYGLVMSVIVIILMIMNIMQNNQINRLKKQINNHEVTVSTLEQTIEQLTNENLTLGSELSNSLTQSRNIYLTFDDGPSVLTPVILDRLKELNVHATFFVNGKNDDAIYQRIINEGHSIGLLSNSVLDNDKYLSVDNYFKNLNALQLRVEKATGYKPILFRFVNGSLNVAMEQSIVSQVIERANQDGLLYFDWNCNAEDTAAYTNTNKIINETKACHSVSYLTNIMVLMHDRPTNESTILALPEIVQYYQNQGYQFRKITRFTPVVHFNRPTE